jgi:hypothetical protein
MSVVDAMYDEETRRYSVDTLTPKQSMFVWYYCGEAKANGRLAAQMAGYSGDANSLLQWPLPC